VSQALIILDIQEGLFSLARDYDSALYRNAIQAHAELGKAFGLPVIMSTSAETGKNPLTRSPSIVLKLEHNTDITCKQGPNGPLPNEFLKLYPDVKVVRRQGEVNAMDNDEFRAAVKATGKSQMILAGIVTDVCKSY